MKKRIARLILCAWPLTGYCLDPYDNFPAQSGSYFLNYTAVYTSDTAADQNGNEHKVERVKVIKDIVRYALYGEVDQMPVIATVLVPIAKVEAFGHKSEGLGDVIFGSGLWFYNTETLHTSASMFIQTPTGKYDATNPASVGNNVWKVTPGLNMAYTRNGYNLEASLKYNNYSKNHDTGEKAGGETLLELYAGRAFGALQYGVHYALKRGANAKLNEVTVIRSGVDSNEVGASVLWSLESGGLSFEYFKEVYAKNTLLGDAFLLRYHHKF